MSDASSSGNEPVEWRPISADRLRSPLVWTGSYVECKLEHPALEPTCLGEQFFPDSIPYSAGDEQRVFYWRSRFSGVTQSEGWAGVCATTHELAPSPAASSHEPTLVQSTADGYELVVDGTIVGDSQTAFVSTYAPPSVSVEEITTEHVLFDCEGERKRVDAGSRERITLSEQVIETRGGTMVPTTPELLVRFPGRRRLYHPAPDGEYCLFPSFGLDIDEIPRPLTVPTSLGELDHDELASAFGIDIADRPYPERILWQAFAVTAFDPHAPGTTELTQFPSGLIAVRP